MRGWTSTNPKYKNKAQNQVNPRLAVYPKEMSTICGGQIRFCSIATPHCDESRRWNEDTVFCLDETQERGEYTRVMKRCLVVKIKFMLSCTALLSHF